MLSRREQDAVFKKAIEQLLKLTVDDRTFLRSIHISPE